MRQSDSNKVTLKTLGRKSQQKVMTNIFHFRFYLLSLAQYRNTFEQKRCIRNLRSIVESDVIIASQFFIF